MRKFSGGNLKKFISIVIFFLFLGVGYQLPAIFSGMVSAAYEPVVVFVLDTGINYEFVEDKTVLTSPVISHGSIVARIIREEAPEVLVINRSIADENGIMSSDLYFAGLARILDYKEKHPDRRILVNISLSFSEDLPLHRYLIKKLVDKGVLLIASAGNQGSANPVYPAAYYGVLAVASAKKEGREAYTNYGNYIDICAPGDVEFLTEFYFPELVKKLQAAGTSFAAPRVTALIAQLLIRDSNLSPDEAVKIVLNTADPIKDEKFFSGYLGAGLINRERALEEVEPYYGLKSLAIRRIIPLVLIILLVLTSIFLGPVNVFIVFLLLIVGFPALYFFGQKFMDLVWLFSENRQVLPLKGFEMVFWGFAFAVAMFLTEWRKTFIILTFFCTGLLAYLLLFYGINRDGMEACWFLFLKYSPVLFLFWAFGLYFWEKILVLNISRDKEPARLVSFLASPSKKVKRTAERILCSPGGEGVLKNSLYSQPLAIKKEILIQLIRLENPPLSFILSFLTKNPGYLNSLILEFKKRKDVVITGIIDILKEGTGHQEKLMAREILIETGKEMNAQEREQIIHQAENLLQSDNHFLRTIFLELFVELGSGQGKFLSSTDFLHTLFKIVSDKNNDMWERYYALRALTMNHPFSQELFSLLKRLEDDKQDLIRQEARALLKELSGTGV